MSVPVSPPVSVPPVSVPPPHSTSLVTLVGPPGWCAIQAAVAVTVAFPAMLKGMVSTNVSVENWIVRVMGVPVDRDRLGRSST